MNANLVRKWIKKATEQRPLPSVSAFVPVQTGPAMLPGSCGDLLTKSVAVGKPCHSSKVSALLPNGISLAVECDDESGLIAIIGALDHVQTGLI
ncbi:hypothetical protein SB748_08735 [Rhizobium sp. SIMBA_035]